MFVLIMVTIYAGASVHTLVGPKYPTAEECSAAVAVITKVPVNSFTKITAFLHPRGCTVNGNGDGGRNDDWYWDRNSRLLGVRCGLCRITVGHRPRNISGGADCPRHDAPVVVVALMPCIRADAQRWRALMATQRFHFMGSAGFDKQGKPRPREPWHFGMEFFSEFSDTEKYPDDFARGLFLSYVEAMALKGAAPPQPRPEPGEFIRTFALCLPVPPFARLPSVSELDKMARNSLEALESCGYRVVDATVDAGREAVAAWMLKNGYATGHGDTIEDMLGELVAQAKEKKDG